MKNTLTLLADILMALIAVLSLLVEGESLQLGQSCKVYKYFQETEVKEHEPMRAYFHIFWGQLTIFHFYLYSYSSHAEYMSILQC
jgi:hypothetical protein